MSLILRIILSGLHAEGAEALVQAAQGLQAGWGWEQGSLPLSGAGIRWAVRSLPAQTILWFCSMTSGKVFQYGIYLHTDTLLPQQTHT